ncbi:MAG: hypothetical protein JWN45_1266 [Acidobacteriaceae bacterium]|nr:hypothetical protein [Acidobacteriaceae bacterium]
MSELPLVSVLFITYQRVHLLRRTVESFLTNTSYPNLELILTDDGSPAWIQKEISELPFHRHILGKKRRGMGANANEGLRHCNGDYILCLQDDWECAGPDTYLREAVDCMRKCDEIGFIRFASVDTSRNSSYERFNVPRSFHLLERPTVVTGINRNLYSDTPHLKSRAFIDSIGPYSEDTSMEQCERDFQDRFLQQSRFKAGFFPDFNDKIFRHIGEGDSLRTKTFRFRFESKISAASQPFKEMAVFQFTRYIYRQSMRLLFRARILK